MSAQLLPTNSAQHHEDGDESFLSHWKHNWTANRLRQEREGVYEKLDKWFSIRQEHLTYLLGELASKPNADLTEVKKEIAILEKYWANVGHEMPYLKGEEHRNWLAKTLSDLETKYKVVR